MAFHADLHVHSKHSRATSRSSDLEHLAHWAARKGIAVVGTGDFTHPAWFEELEQKLVPAEPGLFRLRPEIEREVLRTLPASCQRPVRFLLQVEISTIYKRGERTRKIHHLVYAPDFDTAGRFRKALGAVGNIASDGRPILGLDSRHLLEIALESGDGAFLIPAHIWTPWFAVLGSKSGFDAVADCYGDLAPHIFAVETGLSSDPPMNWRVSSLDAYTLVSNSDAHSPPMLGREACRFECALDYFAMRRALKTREGYGGTVEFFPEEGKYHLDGHRKCGIRLDPHETRRLDGRCPDCGGALTVGVMHRVEALADRPVDAVAPGSGPFVSLVPLPEILSELHGVGAKSKRVARDLTILLARLGPELELLRDQPVEDVARVGSPLLAEAISRLRAGRVHREAGYDGEYGVVRMFEPRELRPERRATSLFVDLPPPGDSGTPSRVRAGQDPRTLVASTSTLPRTPAVGTDHELPGAPHEPRAPNPCPALDPEQVEACEGMTGPVCIVAGPGTGKTRTLIHRLARWIRGGTAPEHCLALTFTRRAASELRERLALEVGEPGTRVAATTFHGFGLAFLQEHGGLLGLHRGFRIVSPLERIELMAELFGDGPLAARRRLAGFERRGRPLDPPEDVDEARYRRALRERDQVDYDDLIELPRALLRDHPELRALCRDRYRFVAVDEYQDVDPAQAALLHELTRERRPQNLCAIGDPDQSIYGFRGSDAGVFSRFDQEYAGARRVELIRNYRSTGPIVAAATSALGGHSAAPGRQLRAVHACASDPPVCLHAARSERSEAVFVSETIEQLMGGTSHYSFHSGRVREEANESRSFADFAVLYRTDAQSAPLIEALDRSGIPYQKRSHDRLEDRPGVETLMRALESTSEEGPLLDRLTRASRRVRLPEDTDVSLLLELLRPLAERCGDDLERFQGELLLGAEVETWDARADRVSLLTIHASKGLEFPVVFLTGCEDGVLPLRFGDRPLASAELDEERRLFFVALSRARHRLFLSHAALRTTHGTARPHAPSPFLSPLRDLHPIEGNALPARRPKAAVQLDLL